MSIGAVLRNPGRSPRQNFREVSRPRRTSFQPPASGNWCAEWLCCNLGLRCPNCGEGGPYSVGWRVRADAGQCGHVKYVPGRKTGVNDAAWLANLTAHGPVRVPDERTKGDAQRTRAHALFRSRIDY